jgi:hypothetical protein
LGAEVEIGNGIWFRGSGGVVRTSTTKPGTVVFPLNSFTDSRLFTTKAPSVGSSIKNPSLTNMSLIGEKPNATRIDKVVEFVSQKYGVLQDLFIEECDGQGILLTEGLLVSQVTVINRVLVINSVKGTGLSVRKGAVEIRTTDNFVDNLECTTTATATVEENERRIALLIAGNGSNNFIGKCQLETSEVGCYVEGPAGRTQFANTRFDKNLLEGCIVATGGNSFASCQFLNNSQETDNTSDGLVFLSSKNVATGCIAISNTTNRQRHGYRDGFNGVGNKFRGCTSNGHGTDDYTSDFDAFSWEHGDGVVQQSAAADPTNPDVKDVRTLVIGSNTTPTRS